MFKKYHNFINENLDHMVYGPEREHPMPPIAIDELPLIAPPANSSDETKKEIEYINQLPMPDETDIKADEHPSNLFADFLAKKNNGPGATNPSRKDVYEYSQKVKPIVIALKNHFNRPRPEQLAKYHGIDNLKVYPSKTANTAAYPSGHSVQPFATAEALSKEYPDLKSELFDIADKIATSRLRMRIHYPSDYEYGKMLGKKIGSIIQF